MSKGERVSVVIAQEIAAREGTDPGELEPLHDVIDTDALDALFQHSAREVTVEFSYRGHQVRVEGPDRIEIRSPRAESPVECCAD